MEDNMGDHDKREAYMSLKAHGYKGNHDDTILRAQKGVYIEAHGFMILEGHDLGLIKHDSHDKIHTFKDPQGFALLSEIKNAIRTK